MKLEKELKHDLKASFINELETLVAAKKVIAKTLEKLDHTHPDLQEAITDHEGADSAITTDLLIQMAFNRASLFLGTSFLLDDFNKHVQSIFGEQEKPYSTGD